MSPFADFKEDVTSILDWIKVMLNFYNMYVIIAWFKFLKQNKVDQMKKKYNEFTFKDNKKAHFELIIQTFTDNLMDITIVFL